MTTIIRSPTDSNSIQRSRLMRRLALLKAKDVQFDCRVRKVQHAYQRACKASGL
jgi:hypothetical protein